MGGCNNLATLKETVGGVKKYRAKCDKHYNRVKGKRRIPRTNYRDVIVKFKGGECEHCGSDDRLHLHHIIPRGEGGEDTMNNLLLVCEDCHLEIHFPGFLLGKECNTG
jgi:5-methylcytosine-specific restriction endonuclease McrA